MVMSVGFDDLLIFLATFVSLHDRIRCLKIFTQIFNGLKLRDCFKEHEYFTSIHSTVTVDHGKSVFELRQGIVRYR
jgi:hypothetical protein